ncbi:MAG: hypothetical protein AAFX04_14465 [Pseudomonadota bacterium]
MRIVIAAGTVAGMLLVSVPAQAQRGVAKRLNGWQQTMLSIADELTQGIDSENFVVEYNSSFGGIEYGTILAPSNRGAYSSLNIIGRCRFATEDVITVESSPFPSGNSTGGFNLGGGAGAPGFLARIGGFFGFRIQKKKAMSYSFDDISVTQISEFALDQKITEPSCQRQFNNRRAVYVVRGNYNMKLSLSQGKSSGFGLSVDGYSRQNFADPTRRGFNVGYNSTRDWKISQKKARPWFRIVSRYVRQSDGSYAREAIRPVQSLPR